MSRAGAGGIGGGGYGINWSDPALSRYCTNWNALQRSALGFRGGPQPELPNLPEFDGQSIYRKQ